MSIDNYIDVNIEKKIDIKKEILQNQLAKIYKSEIESLPKLNIENFSKDNTALVIIDMIEGFTRIGNLKSDRVEKKIVPIANLAKEFTQKEFKILAFADQHDENSPEFDVYGEHCIKGSKECEVVQEIKDVVKDNLLVIPKNSNNGFIEDAFQNWLKVNENINNFIVVGGCTDICIDVFSNSMKSYMNQKNKKGVVAIPESLVATYDIPGHNGEFKHYEALVNMKEKGIDIYSGLKKVTK